MSVNQNFVMSIKGCKNQLDAKNKYYIFEDSVVELKGEFRSAGKTKSIIYFGLKCYKEDGTEITREHVNRINEPLLITSINTDNKSIFVNKNPENWNNKNDSYSNTYLKYVGFYFDGNFNHVPDYLAIYQNYGNNIINLNEEIPKEIAEKIIPYTCKVMNHNNGNGHSFDYSAACRENVPEQWTEYKAKYEGFSAGFGDIKGKFRPGTKIVLPFVICNYGQNEDAILEMRNIEIIINNKPKFI